MASSPASPTLPGLGALALHASLDGPWSDAATRVALSAGPLRLDAHGRVDLSGEAADLDLTATAPAMAPRPDLSWQSVSVDAHVTGKFVAPQGKRHGADRRPPGGGCGDRASGRRRRRQCRAGAGQRHRRGRDRARPAARPARRLPAHAARRGRTGRRPDLPVRFTLGHRLLDADRHGGAAAAMRAAGASRPARPGAPRRRLRAGRRPGTPRST